MVLGWKWNEMIVWTVDSIYKKKMLNGHSYLVSGWPSLEMPIESKDRILLLIIIIVIIVIVICNF